MSMLDTAFDLLSDPTRRRVLDGLRGGERAVGALVARVGIHQSGVSRHLRLLRQAGFVSVRQDGARRLYALRPEPFAQIDAWLAQFRAEWDARLDRFGDALAARQAQPPERDPE